jgi:hypothetical protein
MAYSDDDWDKIRADFECSDLSYSDLADKHGVTKGAISKKAAKDGWVRGKRKQIVSKKVEAIQVIDSIEKETETLTTYDQIAINQEVDRRLRLASLITSGIEKSQKLANDLLDVAETLGTETEGGFKAALIATDNHSKVTQRNAAVIFGTVPESKGSDSNKRYCSIVDKLKAKHARG